MEFGREARAFLGNRGIRGERGGEEIKQDIRLSGNQGLGDQEIWRSGTKQKTNKSLNFGFPDLRIAQSRIIGSPDALVSTSSPAPHISS